MSRIGLQCRIFPQSIPNDWRRDPKRGSELKVYDQLKKQLSADWIVFYDVAWLSKVRGQTPEDGQTDFIIVHPDYGLLLLEVKGGGINYSADQGIWTSIDRAGQTHEIKDPFRQVERSKYALKNKLSTVPALSSMSIGIYDAVSFPDVRIGDAAVRIDAPSQVIVDAQDLTNIEQKLLSVFKYLGGQKNKLPPDANKHLITLLAPTVEFRNPLSAQFEEENAEIVKLTANQFRVLDGFRRTPRLAVGGCAGSGKTILAVQKAKQLASEGFATLLTCFNRRLADHLSDASKGIEGLQVRTFHQLCSELAREAGLTLPNIGSIPQAELDIEFALILCEAMSKRPDRKFDAIIVDEAQDFHRDWWDALDVCLKDGKNSILYSFYDDNQKIYRRLGELPDTFTVYELYDNIRNAQPIFRCAEHYYSSRPERKIEPRGPAGRPVEWLKYQSRTDLQNVLSSTLRRLIKTEQISTKNIVILTPKSLDDKSKLLDLTMPPEFRLVRYHDRHEMDEIACSTINGFKGLESDVVILTELEEDFQKRPQEEITNLLYVAMSRAKNLLIVLSQNRFDEVLLPRS